MDLGEVRAETYWKDLYDKMAQAHEGDSKTIGSLTAALHDANAEIHRLRDKLAEAEHEIFVLRGSENAEILFLQLDKARLEKQLATAPLANPKRRRAERQIPGLAAHHGIGACESSGVACCIHNPSDHHMRDWPQQWRSDRHIMERVCKHGIGHPDPDDLRIVLGHDPGVHGCCGCCVGNEN